VTGSVALHGGGEFLPGDEPFLRALLEAGAGPAAERASAAVRAAVDEPIRVVLIPTAAAGTDPVATARFGSRAFEDLAGQLGRPLRVDVARVVDPASAGDAASASVIAAADLVYLPGGDPALIPAILPGTLAWRSVEAARARGAVLAGASAGAMALGPLTWTPAGIVPGLAVVPGLVVFPHADATQWERQTARFPAAASNGLGILGLGERTGIISTRSNAGAGGGPRTWRVVGEAEVRWLAPGAVAPAILVDGETLDLPG
jgi:cyanophycinase-like exopeptidase